VRGELAKAKKAYGELDKAEKGRFDLEQLANPYSDTRVSTATVTSTSRACSVGIDIEVARCSSPRG